MIRRTNILSHLSDEELMLQVGKGERAAFETLYHRYYSKLVWYARSIVNELPKAEDSVQEVFIKIIERPELFDTNRKFSSWIYTVTGNECKQALIKEQNRLRLLREKVAPVTARTSEMHHASDHAFLKNKLSALYDNLTEKQKQIYTLRIEQELSIKDIAEILQSPEGSVKSGIYYLLKKISEHLKEFTHEK